MTKAIQTYDESNIRVLKGLDPVKLRPGQFTRVDSPLHIVQEVIDNSVDEALAGAARFIEVTLESNGFVTVKDDGRGIPVGMHKEEKVPVIQAIFTSLYSGGKFDKKESGAYGYAGGLHGVGVSVTNALSTELTAEVTRDGSKWQISFNNGDVVGPLKKLGPAEGHGTSIRFRPDPKYFATGELPVAELKELLRSKAVLLPGLHTRFVDATSEQPVQEDYQYENGLATYLQETQTSPLLVPVIEGQRYAGPEDDLGQEGEGAQWAFSWYESGGGQGKSFVNLIQTPEGGTHVAGLRAALFGALRQFIEQHAMLPRGVKLTPDDVFKSVRYVLSVKMLDPGFDNQTKDRLNSRGAVRLVEKAATPGLEAWLNHNPAMARMVAELVINNASTRQRASLKVERRKTSSMVVLPGKLADCESSDTSMTELFLVEGDSAGGSAKQARNKEYQAILPLRGKSLNVWEKTSAEALSNEEIKDISVAIGVQPGKDGSMDLSKLRYGKICILADADVDGFHIQCLLLTLFFKHFPELIKSGNIYVAQPPLYRIDAEGSGKSRPAQKLYAMDEQERSKAEEKLAKKGYSSIKVGRFKGLGEMNPSELWETTLNPDTRRLLKVCLPESEEATAKLAFDHLMGKPHAAWRRDWMEQRGHEVSAD